MTELMQRRRALMGEKAESKIMNPSVGLTDNYFIGVQAFSPPYLSAKAGAAATDFIDAGTSGAFVYYNPNTPSIKDNSGYCGRVHQYANNTPDATKTDYWNCRMNGISATINLSATKRYIRLNLPMENLSGVYAYNSTTGKVYYAGKDSPYYGKTNIND